MSYVVPTLYFSALLLNLVDDQSEIIKNNLKILNLNNQPSNAKKKRSTLKTITVNLTRRLDEIKASIPIGQIQKKTFSKLVLV